MRCLTRPRLNATGILVNYAPGDRSLKHYHSGSVTAYILSGAIRSEYSATGAARACHAEASFFVVLGVDAFLVWRGANSAEGGLIVKMAPGVLAVFFPLQIVLRDLQGLNTRHYQPPKLAAIEGLWGTAAAAPLTLFAMPEQTEARNAAEIESPYLDSLILTHLLNGEVQGLSDFPADQRPPVWSVFFAFRLMVAIGFLMLGVGWWLRWRGELFSEGWCLWLSACAAPAGFHALALAE